MRFGYVHYCRGDEEGSYVRGKKEAGVDSQSESAE